MHLAYPATLQAPHSNTEKQIIQIQYNRTKKPNWQEATSWLFTSVGGDLNSGRPRTKPASRQRGTWTQDHSATFPPFLSR